MASNAANNRVGGWLVTLQITLAESYLSHLSSCHAGLQAAESLYYCSKSHAIHNQRFLEDDL